MVMKNKQQLLEAISKKTWDQAAVNAVIAAKAEKRASKGRPLHVYSLDLNKREGVAEPFNQANMNAFVDMIYAKAMSRQTPLRLQLMVLATSAHWTAVDMLVSQDSAVFFNFDAANNASANYVFNLFKKLIAKYPDESASTFYVYQHDDIPGEADKKYQVQYDGWSCSRFGLDALFHLSNLDTFGILNKQEKRLQDTDMGFKTFPKTPNKRAISPYNIPIELSFLFRNTQSLRALQRLDDSPH